tara:strand:- start:2137 stop:2385 length:249 start_codon:yes stop_codon:yes gene_type:complete
MVYLLSLFPLDTYDFYIGLIMINTKYLLLAFQWTAEVYQLDTGRSDIPLSELHEFFSEALNRYVELESGIVDDSEVSDDLAA